MNEFVKLVAEFSKWFGEHKAEMQEAFKSLSGELREAFEGDVEEFAFEVFLEMNEVPA